MDTTERSTTFIIGGRNGHSRVPTVMSRNVLTLLVVALALGAACGKGGTPTSPTGQAETMTWSVDGSSFAASANGRGAFRVPGLLGLSGSDCGRAAILGIHIPDNASVGTYRIGDAGLSVSWTPDNRTAGGESWLAPTLPGSILSRGAGSLTISSISPEWIAGTFAFEVFPFPFGANREAPSKNLQGRFELSFRVPGAFC